MFFRVFIMTHSSDDALENFLYTNENEGNYVGFAVAPTHFFYLLGHLFDTGSL
jgi:hypothetical protein